MLFIPIVVAQYADIVKTYKLIIFTFYNGKVNLLLGAVRPIDINLRILLCIKIIMESIGWNGGKID